MDWTLYLSIFMTSPDPGFNDIANRIFGHLDDSSFCACVRVCQLWYWYLEPEWQKRRHEKQVRRHKALFEKYKVWCLGTRGWWSKPSKLDRLKLKKVNFEIIYKM